MTPSSQLGRRTGSLLAVRVALMLTLALLPLGLIAIYQTRAVTENLRETAEISQLALAEKAASDHRRLISSALGVAAVIGAVAPELSDDIEDCVAYMATVVEQTEFVSSASFIPVDGRVRCTSTGQEIDVSDWPVFQAQLENPDIRLEYAENGTISGQDVVAITRPILRREELAGFVTASIPVDLLANPSSANSIETADGFVLLNTEGQIAASSTGGAQLPPVFPASIDLARYASGEPRLFTGKASNGHDHTYAVIPVSDNRAYSVTAWPTVSTAGTGTLASATPILFPIAMWIASLAVGYLAVHRLVIRHVRSLIRDMRSFAMHRKLELDYDDHGMSSELREINDEFRAMAESLMRDEAALENALREKNELLDQTNVLMKEVHHRVKNNLQLISSIMNMQIRKSNNTETRAVLERLQERVLGLAIVHRNLYVAGNSGAINAGGLVREIAEQIFATGQMKGIETHGEYENITLFPDQAVPVALLAAEALTNAMKYASAGEGADAPSISASLTMVSDTEARLEVTNSKGSGLQDQMDAEAAGGSDGLGNRLIHAFARQLETDIERDVSADRYTLSITFAIDEFVEGEQPEG